MEKKKLKGKLINKIGEKLKRKQTEMKMEKKSKNQEIRKIGKKIKKLKKIEKFGKNQKSGNWEKN